MEASILTMGKEEFAMEDIRPRLGSTLFCFRFRVWTLSFFRVIGRAWP